MDNPIPINIPDMQSRVEHGYHLTNEEARWLLAQIGKLIPRRERCLRCDGDGLMRPRDGYIVYRGMKCSACEGSGYMPVPEPSYQVIGNRKG